MFRSPGTGRKLRSSLLARQVSRMGRWLFRGRVLFAIGAVGALVTLFSGARANAQSGAVRATRRLITQAVDAGRTVVLEGNTRPEANSRNDRGPVAGDFRLEHMQLQLRLPAEKQQELDQLTRDQQDPKSPNYHSG